LNCLASSSEGRREPRASGVVEAAVCKLLWVSITLLVTCRFTRGKRDLKLSNCLYNSLSEGRHPWNRSRHRRYRYSKAGSRRSKNRSKYHGTFDLCDLGSHVDLFGERPLRGMFAMFARGTGL
jgi:hypothetical protein